MQKEKLAVLLKMSTPKQFAKNEYICHEGQPGSEMYIILKGSVGIAITSSIGTLTQVATIKTGDFFGEMAIFDNLPRSASCIAMEDTVVIAITKDNLQPFLAACPDIARQMMENMSGRIRKLNAELYQNNRFVKNRHVPKFTMPVVYSKGHAVKEPYADPQFVSEYKQQCPICSKAISIASVKRNVMEERGFDTDCRITYAGCEPLWYEIISCPYCYYTNHYLKYFTINNFEFDVVRDILNKEHKPIVESRLERRSDFDILVMKYLQAININEHINAGDNALLACLWRNLYWLAKDVSDKEFATYCAQNAISKYRIAVDENQFPDATSRATSALTLANMLLFCGEEKDIAHYLDIAIDCTDDKIYNKAMQVKKIMEQRAQRK